MPGETGLPEVAGRVPEPGRDRPGAVLLWFDTLGKRWPIWITFVNPPSSRQRASQRGYLTGAGGFGHDMRIMIRLLCCVVIASAAITVWTRAALVFALGPQLAGVCLWIAAGGSLCAVTALAGTRKPGRRRHGPPEPPAGYIVRGDRGRGIAVMTGQENAGRDRTGPAARGPVGPPSAEHPDLRQMRGLRRHQ